MACFDMKDHVFIHLKKKKAKNGTENGYIFFLTHTKGKKYQMFNLNPNKNNVTVNKCFCMYMCEFNGHCQHAERQKRERERERERERGGWGGGGGRQKDFAFYLLNSQHNAKCISQGRCCILDYQGRREREREEGRGREREREGEKEGGTVCWLVAYRPSNMRVYLRDGSAQTILCAATLR